jgi:hypothetical protein
MVAKKYVKSREHDEVPDPPAEVVDTGEDSTSFGEWLNFVSSAAQPGDHLRLDLAGK